MVVNKTFGKIFCMGSIIMDVSIKCKEFPLVGETVYTPYFYTTTNGVVPAVKATQVHKAFGSLHVLKGVDMTVIDRKSVV